MQKAYGLEIPQTLEEICDPRRLALIVYDMQMGVLRQIKKHAEVTARVVEVLGIARNAGIRVFFMRHMSLPRELMGVFQFRMAMAWQRAGCVEDVKPWFTGVSACTGGGAASSRGDFRQDHDVGIRGHPA